MKSLTGKTILLTGANGGLGQEFTRQLLQEGGKLILTDLDEEGLKRTTKDILAILGHAPGKVLKIIGADISTREGCEKVYQETKPVAELDILLNNAGVITYGDFYEVPEEKWEKVISVNLLAPMRLIYLFLPDMLKKGTGHIVNVCSLSGIAGTTQSVPYSASKFGLRGFGISLAGELKGTNIKVSTIYPFWIKTGLLNTPVDGKTKIKSLFRLWTYSPEEVAKASIKGIKKEKGHIYPGFFTKFAGFGARLLPIATPQAR